LDDINDGYFEIYLDSTDSRSIPYLAFELSSSIVRDLYIEGLISAVLLKQSPSVVQWLAYFLLNPRFWDSNPPQDDGFLRAINILSTTSFGEEVKLAIPCRTILWHVKNPCSVKETLVGKIHCHFSPSFSSFATICLLVTARKLWWVNGES
jgi:hypothetical protein